ncbi:MAG: FlxA-like family protein [Agathobacter sp.]|nr:FlxA-like family protein [Agathobacter sp.]
MAIGKIQPIKSTAPITSVSSVTSASKTLQNQLQLKQQTLKKLSNDSNLTIDEKEKERQELQKEIEALKRKLEQMRLKQEEAQKSEKAEQKKETELEKVSKTQTEKEENNATAVQKSEEHKKETIEISAEDAQKILDTNLFLKEEMVQQGVEYDQQNNVRVLTAEIKLDEIHGEDTSEKKEQLKELQEKENFWLDAKNNKEKEQKPQPLISPDMQVVIQ